MSIIDQIQQNYRQNAASVIMALLGFTIALILSSLLIVMFGHSPLQVFGLMFRGAFGGMNAWAKTLSKATPLIFTGLAVALAFKGGLFNLGGEGQLYLGAMTAALIAYYLQWLPKPVVIILCVLVGGFIGGIWAGIAGLLKYFKNTHEVIVSIMQNYIAILLTEYLVLNPLKIDKMIPRTHRIPRELMLTRLIPKTQFTTGFIIAILFAVAVWVLFKYSSLGYEIKAIGYNKSAAATAGIPLGKRIVMIMFLSGFIAAQAGIMEVLGVHGFFITEISLGYGFDGVAVSVLALSSPIGVVFSSVLFGALRAGAMGVDRFTNVPSDILIVLQALVIIFIATPGILRKIPFVSKIGRNNV